MNLLAVHSSHDGAITVVQDDKIIVHAQTERFLKFRGWSRPSEKLLIKIKKLNIKFDKIFITGLRDNDNGAWTTALIQYGICDRYFPFEYYIEKNHHLFHMYAAKVTSDNTRIFVIDGSGDVLNISNSYSQTTASEIESLYFKENLVYKLWNSDATFNKFEDPKWHITNEAGMGHCYDNVTKNLFDVNNESLQLSGKTMALSSYGKYDEELAISIKTQIQRGVFSYIKIPLTDKKEDIRSQNFVKTFQTIFENYVKKRMPKENVTFTGGVAQNVLCNSMFLDYQNFNVDPLCNDQGISLGCLNWVTNGKLKSKNVYLGFDPEYNLDIFKNYKIEEVNMEKVCSIINEKPVALFQGRSEQGQRGLGNRSLLMNAMHPNAVGLVNQIKKREWYRPFAPSILEEDMQEYFEIDKPSPYMLFVYKCKKDIPSITSVDGTSRIQTVNENQNKNYYNLLKTYKTKYGIPLLLNTSLNFSGFPLVEDLDDCKFMLDNSKLENLYLPDINILVSK